MKKYFTLLLALSGLIRFPLLAQKDYRPGFIVQKLDTVKGLIAYQNDRRNATMCIFKLNEEAASQKYSPTEIQAYGFEKGKLFETKSLPGNNGKKEINFLQALVKGKATLYTFKDSASNEHYYIFKNNKLQELKQNVSTETDKRTGNKVKIVQKYYLDTLNFAFQDCKTISTKLAKTQFKANSLTNLFVAYNTCNTPTNLTYIRPIPKSKIIWGPIIGSQFSSLKINADDYYLSIPESYKSKAGIYGGGFINATLPKLIEKLSLQLEAIYTNNNYTATFQQAGNFGRYNTYKINFDAGYIKLPLLVRYTFPQGKIRPFFNGGVLNAFAVKFNQNATRESTFNNTSYKEEGKAIYNIRKYNQGFLAGAGANIFYTKNYLISLEGRYEWSNGFSKALAIQTFINTFYLQMGVGF